MWSGLVPSPGGKKVDMKTIKALVAKDRKNKYRAYKTYLPETYCWGEVITSKRDALALLNQLFGKLPQKDYEIARKLLTFAMLQKEYTTKGGCPQINTPDQLVGQLRRGARIVTSVLPGEIDPIPKDCVARLAVKYKIEVVKVIGKPKLLYICLKKNEHLVPFIRKYHRMTVVADAIQGLAYGYGPIAVANFCLTNLSHFGMESYIGVKLGLRKEK